MSEQSKVDRIKELGPYVGPTEPGDIIRDVWRVASTLLKGQGWDYCGCQLFPCECVMRFMDDLAECVTARHPGSRADRETGSER